MNAARGYPRDGRHADQISSRCVRSAYWRSNGIKTPAVGAHRLRERRRI